MNQDDQLLKELKQAVLDNLENEQFSVEYLSQLIGVSRSHLHRKLKKLKGQSISQFVREIRLEQALNLLRQDVATTSEIAYRVGFNSPSYFNKCFHDYYGYPPGEAKPIFQKLAGENTGYKAGTSTLIKVNTPAASLSPDSKEETSYSFFNKRGIAFTILILVVFAYSAVYFWNGYDTYSSAEKSIAVLPFNNLSEYDANQHFADGLVEDLLNRLTLIEEFKVISRTSSDTYRERAEKKVSEIAEELGVTYIVEGSVQRYDDKARITVQLIDAKNDYHLWSESYDRDIIDIFDIQSEIAIRVASELSKELTNQQTANLQKGQTENVKAFELYQLGRHHWNKRTLTGLKKSITYFQRAIEEDSNFALAIANMADAYFLLSFLETDSELYIKKAEQLALKSLELDHRLPEAYNTLGGIYSFTDLNWGAAEEVFLKGLGYNPNHSNLHHRYAEQLSKTGRHKEARKHVNKAIELDPLSFVIRSVSAQLFYSQGRYEESLAEIKLCNELIPDPFHPRISSYKFGSYCYLGKGREALEYLKNWGDKKGERYITAPLDSIYASSGIRGLLLHKAASTEHTFTKARLYGMCGDYDKALDYLEMTYSNNPADMMDILLFFNFKALNSNSRFLSLLDKMNLPWSPESY